MYSVIVFWLIILSSSSRAQSYQSIKNWLIALKSTDTITRLNAVHGLESIEDSATGIPLLLNELYNAQDYLVLTSVIEAIGTFQIRPSQTIPILISYLRRDEAKFISTSVIFSLSHFGNKAIPYLKHLFNAQAPPFVNETGCYFRYSIPSSYAVIALGMIGEQALQSIESETGWKKERMMKYLYRALDENISDEELANHYHVLKEFTILGDYMHEDTLTFSTSLIDTCLKKIFNYPLLSIRLFQQIAHSGTHPLASRLAARSLVLVPLSLRDDAVNNLSRSLMASDSVLHLLDTNSGISSKLILHDLSESFFYGDQDIPVSLFALNHFVPLLVNGSNEDRSQILKIMRALKVKDGEKADFQTPIIKALVSIAKNNDDTRYTLRRFTNIPEVWQLFVTGFANGDTRWGSELYYADFKKEVHDSLFVNQVLYLLKNTASDNQPKKAGDISKIEDGIFAAAVIDSAYAPILIPPLLAILNDHTYNISEFAETALISGLLAMGSSGRIALTQYAHSTPILRYYFNKEAQVIKECKDPAAYPVWLSFIRRMLQDSNSRSSIGWEIQGASLGKEGIEFLDPLLKAYNENEYYKEETKTSIISIGDTIIPILLARLDTIVNKKEVLEIIYSKSCTNPVLLEKKLENHLSGGSVEYRIAALKHLSLCSAHLHQFIAKVGDALNDENQEILLEALNTLQNSGKNGRPFLPPLYRIIHGEKKLEGDVRLEALFAVANISIGDTSARIFSNKKKAWYSNSYYDYDNNAKLVLIGSYIPKISVKDDLLISCLITLTSDSDYLVRKYSYILLGLVDSLIPPIEQVLKKGLYNIDPRIALLSAQSILDLKMPIDRYANALSLIEATEFKNRFIEEALSYIHSIHAKGCTGAGLREEENLTALNWPPPPASTRDVISASLFSSQKTLGDVCNQITHCLRRSRYDEYRIFDIHDGFAILTRLERISDDGTPAVRDRWTRQKIEPINITEYLKSLFLGTEGKFRVILFVITPLANFKDNGTPILTPDNSDALFREGGVVLPPIKSAQPFENKYVHVLIYQFYKKNGGAANIQYNEGVIPTMRQLTASQIIQFLKN